MVVTDERPRGRIAQRRVKILAGAPVASDVCWHEDGLLDHWMPALRWVIGDTGTLDDDDVRQRQSSTGSGARWRHLPVDKDARLHTGYTQATPVVQRKHSKRRKIDVEPASTGSSSPGPAASSKAKNYEDDFAVEDAAGAKNLNTDDEFIEQSLFLHQDLQSSQLALSPTSSTAIDLTTYLSISETSSFPSFADNTTTTILSQSHLPSTTSPSLKFPAHVTNLASLPSAGHILSIQPQTIVVNLLVGIISILPTRTIRTRYGAFKDLFELLVGDDTAVRLKISFWLSSNTGDTKKPAKADTDDAALASSLQSLQIQDVILLGGVALNAFRDQVFGCSIRNGRTKVSLLARQGVDQVAGLRGVEKVGKVKEWMYRFVNPGRKGVDEEAERGKRKWRPEVVDLPPDTQD